MHNGITIGIVGCGSVAMQLYLPALEQATVDITETIAIDLNAERAAAIVEEFDVDRAVTKYESVLSELDAVFVCTPPAFHAAIARDCIESDIPVLTEKPIATSLSEAQDIVALAAKRDVPYAVMRNWRSRTSIKLLERTIAGERVGTVDTMRISRTKELGWEYKSGYRFDEDRAGGILPDIGPHVFDVVFWLLGSDYGAVEYDDDSLGGVEANVDLTVEIGGVDVSVVLSHTHNLADGIEVGGTNGRIEAPLIGESVRVVDGADGDAYTVRSEDGSNDRTERDRVAEQLQGFLESVQAGEPVVTPAETGIPVLSLIEDCYDQQTISPHSWEEPTIPALESEGSS